MRAPSLSALLLFLLALHCVQHSLSESVKSIRVWIGDDGTDDDVKARYIFTGRAFAHIKVYSYTMSSYLKHLL